MNPQIPLPPIEKVEKKSLVDSNEQICGLCVKARIIDTARFARKQLGDDAKKMDYADLVDFGHKHYKSRVKCYNCLIEAEKHGSTASKE